MNIDDDNNQECQLHIRCFKDLSLKINMIVEKNDLIYFNKSHFYRVALMKEAQKYDDEGNLKQEDQT